MRGKHIRVEAKHFRIQYNEILFNKMLFRPFIFLVDRTFHLGLRLLLGKSAPVQLITMLSTILTLSRILYNNIGVVRTLRTIYNIRNFILSPDALNNISGQLRNILNASGLTRLQINSIIKSLTPLIAECVKVPMLFQKGFTLLKYFLLLSTFSPIFRWLFKAILGLIFSCIGIVWSESLSNITILFELSKSFLSIFENITGLTIPHKENVIDIPRAARERY